MSIFELGPVWAVYICAVAGLVGACLGSMLNCLALRMAAGKPWGGKERSVCMSCGHVLGAWELIPVVSFLVQGGKCRHCGSKLSVRYPATELLMAAVLVSLVCRFGIRLETLSVGVLCACLLALSLVDLDTQIIPDRFLVIPAVTQIALLLYRGGFHGLFHGVLPGLILGGSVLALTLIMDKILKKDTMGGGDIKLLAVLGLYLSLGECLLLVLIACVLGIAMAAICMKVDAKTAFPFAPALSAAAWLTLLAGGPIVSWYLSLF